MEKKKVIGIVVGVLVAVIIVVLCVITAIVLVNRIKRPNIDQESWEYLTTTPLETKYELPAGESFQIICEWRQIKNYTEGWLYEDEAPGFLQWFDPQGRYIPEEYMSRQYEDPVTYRRSLSLTLSFRNPSTSESGVYTCDGGYQNQTKRINIKFYDTSPPTFYSNYENLVFHDTDLLVMLICKAGGGKPMTYEWYNLNYELIENGKFERISVSTREDYSGLKLNGTVDNGNYTCTAKNAYGKASKVFKVSYEIDGEKPKFHSNYSEVTLFAGRVLELGCKASGDLPMNYTWYDQDERIISGGKFPSIVVEPSSQRSSLFIKGTRVDHSGVYTCTAENIYGRASMLFDVKIFAVDIPKFSKNYENITVDSGSELELFCCAENDNGTTKYEWYNQYNDTLTSNQASSAYASSTSKGSVLTIAAVDSNHTGVYECRARNQHGQASKFFDVTVDMPVDPQTNVIPSFDTNYEYFLVKNGCKLELRCSASGDKPMTYLWHNQFQEEIGSEEELTEYVSTTEDASVLVIKKLKISHKGLYTCTAKNQHGMYSKLFEISVYPGNSTNEISISHVETRKVTSNSVFFGIASSESVNTIEVKYTESEIKNESIVSFKAGDAYEVTNLIPAGLYHFQFRADDESWSDVFNVTLLPDRPDVIITRVQSDRLQIEWFKDLNTRFRDTISKYEISYYSVQIEKGMYWKPSSCVVNITLPACQGSSYIITGLTRGYYTELQIRGFTESGYGEPYKHKFYTPRD